MGSVNSVKAVHCLYLTASWPLLTSPAAWRDIILVDDRFVVGHANQCTTYMVLGLLAIRECWIRLLFRSVATDLRVSLGEFLE
jgi:hypothetical protein